MLRRVFSAAQEITVMEQGYQCTAQAQMLPPVSIRATLAEPQADFSGGE
jgi:hypothetical protein